MVGRIQNVMEQGWKVIFLMMLGSSSASCSVGCSNKLSDTFENPSGDKVIFKVQKNCSATTPFTYKYYISDNSDGIENVNAEGFQPKGELFLDHVRGEVEVVWSSDTSVNITRVYLPNAYKPIEVTYKNHKLGDITITFQGL